MCFNLAQFERFKTQLVILTLLQQVLPETYT